MTINENTRYYLCSRADILVGILLAGTCCSLSNLKSGTPPAKTSLELIQMSTLPTDILKNNSRSTFLSWMKLNLEPVTFSNFEPSSESLVPWKMLGSTLCPCSLTLLTKISKVFWSIVSGPCFPINMWGLAASSNCEWRCWRSALPLWPWNRTPQFCRAASRCSRESAPICKCFDNGSNAFLATSSNPPFIPRMWTPPCPVPTRTALLSCNLPSCVHLSPCAWVCWVPGILYSSSLALPSEVVARVLGARRGLSFSSRRSSDSFSVLSAFVQCKRKQG